MLYLLVANTPIYAFQQSDLFARTIVGLLLVASIFAWSIMIEKYLYLRLLRRQLDGFVTAAERAAGPTALFLELERHKGPGPRICTQMLGALAAAFHLTAENLRARWRRHENVGALGPAEFEQVRTAATAAVDEEVIRMEIRVGLLSSIVSASPFLGLLGTVWGVMLAFCGMAVEGRADIGAIAPGVSGALLTTVVGLLVAIPAVIGYNWLVNDIRLLTVRLDNFTEGLLGSLRAEYEHPEG